MFPLDDGSSGRRIKCTGDQVPLEQNLLIRNIYITIIKILVGPFFTCCLEYIPFRFMVLRILIPMYFS